MINKLLSYLRHQYYELFKISLFALAVLIVIWQMPPREGKFKYEYSKGKPWQQETLFFLLSILLYLSRMKPFAWSSKPCSKKYIPISS